MPAERRTTRPGAGARALAGLLLAAVLAGCRDAPPDDFEAIEAGCESLVGEWIVTEADLRWIAPDLNLAPGVAYPFLVIERDHGGHLSLALRRRHADLLAEAATLRMADADAYRVWRAQTLGLPIASELSGMVHTVGGPARDRRWNMAMPGCVDGWRGGGSHSFTVTPRPGSEAGEHLAFVSLARDAEGRLLVQHHVRRENTSDFVFFGQPLRWYSYAYSAWHRIAPAPPGSAPAPLTAAELPDLPGRMQRLALEYGRRESWARFEGWVRDNVPAGVTITVLRQRQMDPAAMLLPPDQLRIELAGHWPEGAPDPFMPLLERHPRVGPVEVKQSRLGPRNRPYRLLEFTLTVTPEPL